MDKEFKKILRQLLKNGWRRLPDSKHNVVQHIASGRKLQFSMSPSDHNAHHQFRRAAERIEKEAKEKSDAELC